MSDSKATYYVSVQDGSILPDQGAAAYEFVIEATDEEVKKLREMFEERLSAEFATYQRAPIPGIPYHQDKENDAYDYMNKVIYQTIHDLGTNETRDHIQSMGILNGKSLSPDADYDNEGMS